VVLDGPNAGPNPSHRTYFADLDSAIKAFGWFDGQVAAIFDIHRIMSALVEAAHSPVFEVYILDDRTYVAVLLESDPDTAAAFIHFGYVDHVIKLPGSQPSAQPGRWRTDLPTAYATSNSNPTGVSKTVLCPNCFLQVPVYGSCTCGWEPSPGNDQRAAPA
jgi:hypothetical protein